MERYSRYNIGTFHLQATLTPGSMVSHCNIALKSLRKGEYSIAPDEHAMNISRIFRIQVVSVCLSVKEISAIQCSINSSPCSKVIPQTIQIETFKSLSHQISP